MSIERELLAQCGLTETEQSLMLDLLQRSGSHAGTLSRRLGMKRATVYSALQSLEDLGLVIRKKEEGTTIFSTVPAATIPQVLVRRARAEFETVKSAGELLAEQLKHYERMQKQVIGGYEISTVDSKDAAFLLIYQAITAEDFSAIFDLESAASGAMEGLFLKFIEETSKNKIHIRDVVVAGPKVDWYLGQLTNPNHQVKILPSSHNIITDFVITQNSVFLTNYTPGEEMLIQIKHKDYYDSMMSVFQFVWDNLPLAYPKAA